MTTASTHNEPRRRVFMVHGRDAANTEALRQLLRALDLSVVKWEQAVEATGDPNPFVGDIVEAGINHSDAVVVLFTPDDQVKLRDELLLDTDGADERTMRGQPRPNVIYETGLARAMAPDRTLIIAVGEVKVHSDIAGRHLVIARNDAQSRHAIAHRLKGLGLQVDMSGTDWLSAGRFVPSGGQTAIESSTLRLEGHLAAADSSSEDDGFVGFLELLADMEEAMPEATEIMTELAVDVQALGDLTRKATGEMTESDERGLGSRGRLAVAIRYAENLQPLAEKTELLVDQFSERINRVEGGVLWMFDRIESGPLSSEERAVAQTLLDTMVKAGGAAGESIASTQKMIDAMEVASKSARPLRTVTTRLMAAYRQLVLMMAQFETWSSRATELAPIESESRQSSEEE
jgi:predicted nucleotide-binding protein